MSKQLEPKYNHHKVEAGKYRHWLDKKYFEAGDVNKKPYSIRFFYFNFVMFVY